MTSMNAKMMFAIRLERVLIPIGLSNVLVMLVSLVMVSFAKMLTNVSPIPVTKMHLVKTLSDLTSVAATSDIADLVSPEIVLMLTNVN